MRRHLAACAALLVLAGNPAGAEYQGGYSPPFVAPTPQVPDSSNRIATTEWVNTTLSAGLPLAAGAIFIGSASNLATARTPSGDCTISQLGVITCTQSAGAFLVNGTLTVSGTIIDATGGLSIGSPTGGSQGLGTINVATGYYLNGVLQPKWLAAGTSGGIPYFTSTTNLASSAVLGANLLVLGGGAGTAPTTLGSLGTTTTVLHGNAAGAPTFGAVSLTADVTGRLPFANLTQGSARSVFGVTGNGTADFASIQGAAGQILGVPNAGTSLAFTATPQLGISGTLGSLTFGNATSGLLTLQPVTGALGTVTVLIPTGASPVTLATGLVTTQSLTSGSGATYTTPAGVRAIEVYAVGGGGGGAGSSNTGTTPGGSAGGTSIFNSIVAAAGAGGATGTGAGGAGGAGGTGGSGTATRRARGGPGGNTLSASGAGPFIATGSGGPTYFGGGPAGVSATSVGAAGGTNTGEGGSGGLNTSGGSVMSGAGGGGGELVYLAINNPAATYTYTIGAGGAGGVSTSNGGAGGSGFIFVVERY